VVAETRIPALANSPWIRTQPTSGYPGEPEDQLAGGRIGRRPPHAACPSVGPLPPHELPVPPEQRLRAHHERGPGRTGEHPARRCEYHSVEPAEAGAILLTAQDLQLVTKDEDLDVFGRILRPGATREAEEPTYDEIGVRRTAWSEPLPNLGKGDATRGLVGTRSHASMPFGSRATADDDDRTERTRSPRAGASPPPHSALREGREPT
jgi:hypothetical protein